MKFLFVLAGLFTLAMFGDTINARKDAGEYWRGGVTMPELDQGVLDVSKITSTSPVKNHCHTLQHSQNNELKDDVGLKAKKSFSEEFEPRPNISSYTGDGATKSFTKEFKPIPNISSYTGDGTTKSFTKEFEPRPNISSYNGDDTKLEDKNSFAKEFEPRPNISAYTDGDKLQDEKSFFKEFEPRPNISAYNDDAVGVEAKKAF